MATPPAGASCWICLEEGPDDSGQPLKRNCACRGNAGWAHVSCIASNAFHRHERAWSDRGRGAVPKSKDLNAIWTVCQHCKQEYQGDVGVATAVERMHSVKNVPESDFRYISALINLGMARISHGSSEDHGAGIEALERALDILHANRDDPEDFHVDVEFDVLGCLATVYFAAGDTEKASECIEKCKAYGDCSGVTKAHLDEFGELMKILQPDGDTQKILSLTKIYEKYVDEYGKDHAVTLNAAQVLSTALMEAEKYEESIAMHRDTYERSKRMLGPEHPDTADRREKYFLVRRGYGPRMAKLSVEDPQLNGKEVVVLRATKDGKKYVVDLGEGGLMRKVKVSPKQLHFAEGTPIWVQTHGGYSFDAFVDSFESGHGLYGVWILVQEGGFDHMNFAREEFSVVFTRLN